MDRDQSGIVFKWFKRLFSQMGDETEINVDVADNQSDILFPILKF